jgi:hypothetical protein
LLQTGINFEVVRDLAVSAAVEAGGKRMVDRLLLKIAHENHIY